MFIFGDIFFGDVKVIYNESGLYVFTEKDSNISERLRDVGIRWNDKKNSMFISSDKPLRIEAAFDILDAYKKEYMLQVKDKKEFLKTCPIKSYENISVIDRRSVSHGFIVFFLKYDKKMFLKISMITGATYNKITSTWHIPTESVDEYNELQEKLECVPNASATPERIFDFKREADGFSIKIYKNSNNISIQISKFTEKDLFEIKKIKGIYYDKSSSRWVTSLDNEKDVMSIVQILKGE